MIEYSIPIQVLYPVSDTTGEASQSGKTILEKDNATYIYNKWP